MYLFLFLSEKNRVQKLRFLAFPQGPGGFREVRGPGRNHFHLFWYLVVPGITSYGQTPWGICFTVYLEAQGGGLTKFVFLTHKTV